MTPGGDRGVSRPGGQGSKFYVPDTRPGGPVTGVTGKSFMCKSFMCLFCSLANSPIIIRSRPGKPNQRKGQNEKFMNFAHFSCEFWCFFLRKTSTIHISNFCSGMPLRKVHELTFLWFGFCRGHFWNKFGNFDRNVTGENSRRPPDYSPNLWPPKTFAIWLF